MKDSDFTLIDLRVSDLIGTVPSAITGAILTFASGVIEAGTCWQNQDPSQAREGLMKGAAFEYVIYELMDTSPPDLTIYDRAEKSHKPDLFTKDGRGIHAKSSPTSQYGYSWVFQESALPHLNENDLFIFGIEIDPWQYELCWLGSIGVLMEHELFGTARLKKYQRGRNPKRPVYHEKIKAVWRSCFSGSI